MKWVWGTGLAALGAVVIMMLVGAMLPRKHRATRSIHLKQKPERVYSLLAGPPEWRSDLKESGALPDGRWWEENRRGRRIVFELAGEKPPFRRVVRTVDNKLPFSGTWTTEIAPAADGCVVRITEDGEISNLLFRFLARFAFGYAGSIETTLRDLSRAFGEAVRIEE